MKNMGKILLIVGLVLLLNITLVYAHEGDEFCGGTMMGDQIPTQMMGGNWGYFFPGWIFQITLFTTLIIGVVVFIFLGMAKIWRSLSKSR